MDEAQKQVAAIQANQHSFKKPSRPVEDNTAPAALESIDNTFTRLKAICVVGSAFKTDSEEYIVKQEWMLAFREEGVTKKYMINDGIEFFRAKSRKTKGPNWFPSIGEFIDACLGSDDKLERALIAYGIFSNPKWKEKQICNIGVMVVAQHGFDLKAMKADEGKKRFIELYLEYASTNEFKLLDAFALTETVQLSPKQQKDADKRKLDAQNEFLAKFGGLALSNDTDSRFNGAKKVKAKIETGVKTGKIQTTGKTMAQKEAEKQRQLNSVKGLL